jgi:uncharacterized repeat protein (TIGR01451 family)
LTALIGDTLTATHNSVAGCGVWTDTVQIIEPTFERKQLYFTPTLQMDRVDPVATNDLTTSRASVDPGAVCDAVVGAASDNFESNTYTGGSGWLPGGWAEIGEVTNPSLGQVQIVTDLGDLSLRISGGGNTTAFGAVRSVNLSGAALATLRFDYRRVALDDARDDRLFVQASTDGVTWNTMFIIAGLANDTTYQSVELNLTPHISANTRIRFITGISNNFRADDYVYIDNVAIDKSSGAGCIGPITTTTLGAVKDNYLNQDRDTRNYGASTTLVVDRDGSKQKRPLLEFDFSSLPAGAIITSAQLELRKVGGNNGVQNVDIFPVTADWIEGTQNDANGVSNWNERDVATNWTTAGGDFGSPYFTVVVTNNGTYTWDVTSIVSDMVSAPASNFGFLLATFDGGGGRAQNFASRENSVSADRPRLVVSYGVPVDEPGTVEFTQSPAMADMFEIYSGAPIVVTSYIQVTDGTFVNPPDIDALLRKGTTTLLSLTGSPTVTVINLAQQIYRLEWSGNLPSDVTIDAGEALNVKLSALDTFDFDVLYDSKFYPSRIDMPTNTVITLDSLGIYNAAYPVGTPITSINTVGSPVYVRAVASDPFGQDDITSLDVVIKNAAGTTVFSTTLGNANAFPLSDSSKVYEVQWIPTAPGVYTIHTTAHEGYEGTVSASDETTFEVAVFPDVVITKSDGGVTVDAGQTVVYTLTYQNIGTGAATGVTITDTLQHPAYSTFNSLASSPGWSGASPTYTYTVGDLAPGESGTVQFAVTVNSPLPTGVSQIANAVVIAATNEPPANQGNNTGSDTTPVNAAPDLVITKTDNDNSVAAGGSVTYTISYSNVGTQDATGVTITETLPPGATIHPSNLVGNGGIWTQIAPSQFRTTIGNLNAGVNGTVSITLVAPNPVANGVEQWTNTAVIADDGSNGPDPTPGNNTATDTTPVDAAPDLVVTKTDGGIATVVGGTILYTITYTNVGTQTARQVSLTELLPLYTRFDDANSIGDWDDIGGGEYFLLIGNLDVGQSGVATFAVIVDGDPSTPVIDSLPDGVTQIFNTVVIADDGSNGPDPNPGNNTANETTPVAADPEADLAITKTNNVDVVNPGSVVTYTIVVTNLGPDDVTGATVQDVFPPELTNVSFTSVAAGGAAGNTASAGPPVSQILNTVDLPYLSTITYTVTGTIGANEPVGLLTNIATVTKDGLVDPDTSNNTAIDEDPIIPISDLSVAKAFVRTVDADGSNSTTPGDTVVFTVT